MSRRPLITVCDNLTHSVHVSSDEESGSGHIIINENYVNESDVTETGSRHAEVKVNGVDKLDDVKSGSCHVSVKANDVIKSTIIDSGSGHMKINKKSINKSRDDGKLAVKLCKKTYVLSNTISEGHSEVVEGNLTSRCADGEHHQISNSVPDSEGTAVEQVDVLHGSIGGNARSTGAVKPDTVSHTVKSSDSQLSSANDYILPTNCDSHYCATDNVSTQLALSTSTAKTKLGVDLCLRSKNTENIVDGEVIVVGNESSETGKAQQQISRRLISTDLPAVHKEVSEADPQQRHANCRLVFTKLMSDNLPTVHSGGSETAHCQHADNSQLPPVHNNSGETDQQQRHSNCQLTSDNLPKTDGLGGIETDQSTDLQLSTEYGEGSETGHETGQQQPHINCMLTSDNLPKSKSLGIETDENTNCQLATFHSECSAADQRQQTTSLLPKVECKGGETERLINCQLETVHKRQMLVDCDVNVPHNIWTSIVNHNPLGCNDSSMTPTHCRASSVSYTADEVSCLAAESAYYYYFFKFLNFLKILLLLVYYDYYY